MQKKKKSNLKKITTMGPISKIWTYALSDQNNPPVTDADRPDTSLESVRNQLPATIAVDQDIWPKNAPNPRRKTRRKETSNPETKSEKSPSPSET
jgi:hypothetical protein